MDADQFDALAARLTALLTRRRSLATLGTIGLATMALAEGAAGKGKGKKKRKKRRKMTTTSTTPAPTCSDGIRNGSETGVDCGGSCSPCATGQPCSVPTDCAGARCAGGMCATCAAHADCATNGFDCMCDTSSGVCYNVADGAVYPEDDGCAFCPAGTAHCSPDGFGHGFCFPRCGEVFPA